MLFVEPYFKVLLILHLITSFFLLGVVGHSVAYSIAYLKGRFTHFRAEYWFTLTAVILYIADFVLGALVYPVFRVRIRAEYFDANLPWATSLFEIKEHFAAVGLALILSIFLIRNTIDPQEGKDKLWTWFAFWILVCVVLLYQAISGPYLVLLRSVQ
jgi:hypothetical protein